MEDLHYLNLLGERPKPSFFPSEITCYVSSQVAFIKKNSVLMKFTLKFAKWNLQLNAPLKNFQRQFYSYI